jgi:hypothetical protein
MVEDEADGRLAAVHAGSAQRHVELVNEIVTDLRN